ncbi:MAG: hypothetical protein CBD59_00995 [Alphaproteobacteria bacterium TMED199]|nr:MAG: hypothetical protein CBD59_00995 [Alphaproteobacteria bacterium TMED199]
MPKTLITFQDFKMSQSNRVLLENINISIHQFDRIVLVGQNGCGKSSLLSLLKNKEECDSGSIWIAPNMKIDFLEQDPPEPSINNLLEFLSQDNQHPNLSRTKEIIEELNLKKINLKNKLSGGEIRKIYIAKLILSESELLLLDEPTNHLDLPTIDWLEKKLLSLNKTIIIVSHDQEFLKKISTKTFWIHQAQILKREGPYSNFQSWTNEVIEVEKMKSHKLKQKIKSEKKWAVEGISARRKRNMGRLRDLEKLSKNYESSTAIVKKPLNIILNKTNESALNIIETFDLSFSYNIKNENENIFSKLNLKIRRDDRIGIIGANGSGKSTLVKILQGIYPPKNGKIKFGANVNVKYFDQNKQSINLNKTPWSTLAENGDYVDFMGDKIHVLSYLKKFLFDEKKSLQSNLTLSGGEKVRLSLAKLFLNKHNFLILDEPTNDLDFDTLNLLETSIKNYDGTVLIISHDRFFLDNTVEKLIVFENNNRILEHEGNFSDYYEKFGLEKLKIINDPVKTKISNKKIISKKFNTKKMSYKDTYNLEMLPLKIEKLEKELKEHETILNDTDLFKNNRKAFDKTVIEITNLKKMISETENKWLELQILNDDINNP